MKLLKPYLFIFLLISGYNIDLQADNQKTFWQIIIGIFNSDDNTNNNQPDPQSYTPYSNSYQNVDYSHVRQEFRSAFDNTLATSYQTTAEQNEIKRVREKSSNEVIYQLQTQYGNLSEQESKLKARQLAQSAALEFVIERTVQITHHEISRIRQNPPINPMFLLPVDRDYVTQTIKQEILNEAQNHINEHYGSLRDYVGQQLCKKVSFKVEQAFGIHDTQAQSINYNQDPYAHLPASQRPSAPPCEQSQPHNNIREIYPLLSGNSMKVFRDEACCICLEDFSDIGVRVILPCGHDICPTCCKTILQSDNNKCPKCRYVINRAEFPLNYLY